MTMRATAIALMLLLTAVTFAGIVLSLIDSLT